MAQVMLYPPHCRIVHLRRSDETRVIFDEYRFFHADHFPTGTDSNSPFASLLDALHRSRRLQAERVLAQYRHLIAKYQPPAPASNAEGDDHVGH